MNKKVLFALAAIATVSAHALFASPMAGLNFNAPTVASRANVVDPVKGEIVFDQDAEAFYGNTDGSDTGWTPLSSVASSIVSSGSQKIEYAILECDASSQVLAQSGSWISSISNNSTGSCGVSFAGSAFSQSPGCTFTVHNGGASASNAHSVSTNGITINAFTANTTVGLSSYSGTLICMGPQ